MLEGTFSDFAANMYSIIRKIVGLFSFFLIMCLFGLVRNLKTVVGMRMDTYRAPSPLPQNMFLFCFERNIISSRSHACQAMLLNHSIQSVDVSNY